MNIRMMKRYFPAMVSLGIFTSLFVFFMVSQDSPDETDVQLSPRHSAYTDKFGEAKEYGSSYISTGGNISNVRINDKPGVSEPRIISSPVKKNIFAVVSNDFSEKGFGSVFFTADGGASWKRSRIPLSVITGDIYYSDPWADYDGSGNLAYITVAVRSSDENRKIIFNMSPDNGQNWLEHPVVISGEGEPGMKLDKPKVYCDKMSSRIYLSWLEKGKGSVIVSFCISENGGKSFSEVKTIAEGDISYAHVLQGEDNKIYFLYTEDDSRIMIKSSTDFGASWSSGTEIAEYKKYGDILGKQRVIKNTGEAGVRVNSDLQAVISGKKIYITYSALSENEQHSEIYMVSGDLSNMTFSKPVAPGGMNTGHDRFMPSITSSQDGGIHILYYTSEGDADNIMTEVHLLSSSDFGKTFLKISLSTEAFNPLDVVVDNSYMGDYISIAAGRDELVAVWTDGRNGNLDLMAGIMPFADKP